MLISIEAGAWSDQKLTSTTTDIDRWTTSVCSDCSPTTSNEKRAARARYRPRRRLEPETGQVDRART